MQKLKKLTSSVDFGEQHSAKVHRLIYDRLHLLSNAPDASSTTAPPFLVFYAARNILSPSFILGQIPDLLNLLAAIETFRLFAALKSDEALERQRHYEREKTLGRQESVRLLAANEVRALQRFVVRKHAQRREYIVLVGSLILLYIHHLWTAPESCLLAKRLNDFFPGSVHDVDAPSELLFHLDLSEDERAYFGRLKQECREWMRVVMDWEKKREEARHREGQASDETAEKFEDDFRDAFPQPCKPSEIARNVEIYMNKVEDMIHKLEQWFAPSQG